MMITVYEGEDKQELPFKEGDTILEALQKGGVRSITAPCGGKGTCRKCTVFVMSEDFLGTCLACTTAAKDQMIVEIVPEVRISIADQGDGDVYGPTPGQSGYAVACDIGTTTVVCRLLNLSTGEQLSSVSGSSSQSIFGGDVLSRLESAKEGHADEIHEMIIHQVNHYIEELCREEQIQKEEIKRLAVSGNTIMMHFFAGIDPSAKSTAPFEPVSLFGETKSGAEIGLDFEADVFLCPAVSGFIGSDLACGILASGMHLSKEKILLIDLGTNTEVVMGNREKIVACSVDGGAVFKASLLEHGMIAGEGAIAGVKLEDGKLVLNVLGNVAPKGICGSGFIDALGVLFREEILDDMGHIVDPEETDSPLANRIGTEEGRNVFYLTEDRKVFLSQADISKFLLAKAAISAAIEILAKETDTRLSELERLVLGGAFGTFVHRSNAAVLGIIPRECKGKTMKSGDIALVGASSAALSEDARKELNQIQKDVQVIDLPTHPMFSDAFMDGMIIE